LRGVLAPAPVLADLAETCGVPAGTVCRWVLDASGSEGLARTVDVAVHAPLRIALVLVAAVVVTHLLRRAIDRMVLGLASVRQRTRGEGRDQRVATISGVLRAAVTAVIWTIAGITAMQELGLKLGGLVAGATVVGAAVGFGAQTMVRDFLSGFFLLVEDQFVVGDRIDVGVASGQVERVTLRVTQLRDDEGTVWYVPNGRIERVANKTQGYARAVLDVGVAHGTDLARAAAAIHDAAAALCAEPLLAPLVLQGPEGPDGVQSFDSEQVVLRVAVRVQPGAQWRFLRALRARLLDALPAAGVGLPVSTGVVASEGGAPEPVPAADDDE
jgi:small conductance mechanosensitive channel